MGKLEIFEIILDQNPAVFYAGQIVSGRVIVQLNEEMKMRGVRLQFMGGARVHWTERHTTGSGDNRRTVTRHYNNRQIYFNMEVTLFGKAQGQSGPDPHHPVGQHIYPFQFTLQQNLPSSFEAVTGQVRYYLQGTIDKPWKFDHHCKKPFTVLSVVDFNMQPGVRDQQSGQNSKTLCCLCCKTGPISSVMFIDRKGFVPGEFVTINGEVTNHSNRKMCSSSIQLRMLTVFIATNKARRTYKTLSLIKKGEIEPGDSETWSGERLYIPPLPPSQLPNCDIIQIQYHIVMVVDPSGPSFDLEVPLELLIGTVPLTNVNSVFANTACPFSLPMGADGEISGQDPMAPPTYTLPTDTNTAMPPPPPSYAECVLGKTSIREEGDNEHTRGEMDFAPVYPYYSWSNPAVTNPPK